MDVREWLLTISMIGHFANMVYGYIERRNDKTNEKIAALTTKIDELERELALLRGYVQTAPNHNDLAKIYESQNALAEKVNQLIGENRGQSDTLRLILNQITQKGMA